MNLLDILDIYAMENDSDDVFLLLQDYTLDSRINRDNMNKIILKDLGACRPITTDCDLFKILLESFFNKYNYNIGKLLDTMYYKYNPLHNKDLLRTQNEDEHRHSVGDIDNTDTYDTNTDQTNTGTDTNEKTVSAYDSPNYQPKERDIETQNLRTDNDVHHEGETTSDIESTVDTDKHIGEKLEGKDGETSYQTLIEQERKLAQFNIFNWIINQMRKELFLLVY